MNGDDFVKAPAGAGAAARTRLSKRTRSRKTSYPAVTSQSNRPVPVPTCGYASWRDAPDCPVERLDCSAFDERLAGPDGWPAWTDLPADAINPDLFDARGRFRPGAELALELSVRTRGGR